MHDRAAALRLEMRQQAAHQAVKARDFGLHMLFPQLVGKFANQQLMRHARSGKHQGVDAPVGGDGISYHAFDACAIGGVELVHAGLLPSGLHLLGLFLRGGFVAVVGDGYGAAV